MATFTRSRFTTLASKLRAAWRGEPSEACWRAQDNSSPVARPCCSCVRLRSLDLSFNALTSIEPLPTLPDLRQLKLYGNQIGSVRGLAGCPALETLSIHANRLQPGNGDSSSPGESLASLQQLATLRIDSNPRLGDGGVHALQLAALPRLTELNASGVGLTSTEALRGVRALTTLQLDRNRLGSPMGVPPLSPLSALSTASRSLSELHLGWNGLRDASLAALAPLSSLITLRLNDNRLASLAQLPIFRRLVELDVCRNRITSLAALGLPPPSEPQQAPPPGRSTCPSGAPDRQRRPRPKYPQLEILDASFNQIVLTCAAAASSLKPLTRAALPALSELALAGNPGADGSGHNSAAAANLGALFTAAGFDNGLSVDGAALGHLPAAGVHSPRRPNSACSIPPRVGGRGATQRPLTPGQCSAAARPATPGAASSGAGIPLVRPPSSRAGAPLAISNDAAAQQARLTLQEGIARTRALMTALDPRRGGASSERRAASAPPGGRQHVTGVASCAAERDRYGDEAEAEAGVAMAIEQQAVGGDSRHTPPEVWDLSASEPPTFGDAGVADNPLRGGGDSAPFGALRRRIAAAQPGATEDDASCEFSDDVPDERTGRTDAGTDSRTGSAGEQAGAAACPMVRRTLAERVVVDDSRGGSDAIAFATDAEDEPQRMPLPVHVAPPFAPNQRQSGVALAPLAQLADPAALCTSKPASAKHKAPLGIRSGSRVPLDRRSQRPGLALAPSRPRARPRCARARSLSAD